MQSLYRPFLFVFFAAAIVGIAWFVPRETPLFIVLYALSFGLYFWATRQEWSDRVVLKIALFLRLAIVLSLPLLSNDIYRFIWDGRLLVCGQDPFALRPSEWLSLVHPPPGINSALHHHLYGDNYTVYPPIHQIIFWLSAKFSSQITGSIFIIKSLLVLGDLWLLFFLYRQYRTPSSPNTTLLFYALNPLILLEIAGNGHFEGLMMLFLVIGLLGLRQNKIRLAGIGFGLAIATKLLPLMLLPLVLRYLSFKKAMFFLGWLGVVNIVLWFPLWMLGSLHHLMDSIWLYFESFEFNASVYYILKWILPQGWRTGLITNGLTIASILFIALRQKINRHQQLVSNMAIIWSIYLLNSAIVHPWYVIPVLILSLLSEKMYGIIWTGLIYLSYSHYWGGDMSEKYWLIGLEYLVLFVWWLRHSPLKPSAFGYFDIEGNIGKDGIK